VNAGIERDLTDYKFKYFTIMNNPDYANNNKWQATCVKSCPSKGSIPSCAPDDVVECKTYRNPSLFETAVVLKSYCLPTEAEGKAIMQQFWNAAD